MFSGCNSLVSLPDISKWIIFDIDNSLNIFNDCFLLEDQPNLSFKSFIDLETIYDKSKNNNKKLRIFGKIFVNKNKNKCKIIYKNKKYKLKEYF